MAWTQADIDALEAALKTGVLTVHYADRSVTYRSLAEMLQLRATMKDTVLGAAGTAKARPSFAKTSKG